MLLDAMCTANSCCQSYAKEEKVEVIPELVIKEKDLREYWNAKAKAK